MSPETPLTQIGKSDFFAVLASGSYVAGSCALLLIETLKPHNKAAAEDALSWATSGGEKHWAAAVAFLFVAFLTGSVLRAFRVTWVDHWCNKFFGTLKSGMDRYREWLQGHFPVLCRLLLQWGKFLRQGEEEALRSWSLLDGGEFPYPKMLEDQLSAVKRNFPHLVFNMPDSQTAHRMYNFWKMTLCREAWQVFDYTQEQEARVRLFVTMSLAALFSMVLSAIGLIMSACGDLGSGWGTLNLVSFGFAAVIFLAFGSQIRRVRAQEVRIVFMAYLSLTMDKSRMSSKCGSENPGCPGKNDTIA